MRRGVSAVLALVVLVFATVAPVWLWGGGSGAAGDFETTRITAYEARFTIGADGALQARERISVEFPVGEAKHGIFRFWDTADENAPHERRDPESLTVTRNGAYEPFEVSKQDAGRYVVARIGSPSSTVSPGVHTYEMTYAIDDVVLPDGDRASQFYWNVIPGGWAQHIEKATITVELPADAQHVRCAVGFGSTGGCRVRGEGTTTLRVKAADLDPRTPLTLQAGMDQPAPPISADRPWSPPWDRVLGPGWLPLLVVLLLACGAGLAGHLLVRRSWENDPAFPLFYSPPPDIGPAQASYLLNEKSTRRAFVATLLHLAERGALEMHRSGNGTQAQWGVTPTPGTAAWEGLDPVTRETAAELGLPERPFLAATNASSGLRLKRALEQFDESASTWARTNRLLVPVGLASGGSVMVILAGVLAVTAVLVSPWTGMSALALVPGAFAASSLGWLAPGAGTVRTRAGRELWSRVGGFRRVLSTPSSQQRFDFAGREELYAAYLPWAVAFGVADEWARKFRAEVGVEPPAPAYFGGYTGSQPGAFVDLMIDNFDTTVSSAIASYEASISTSTSSTSGGFSFGGGGGGFSGGGGGGGGGGGSW